MEALLEMQFQRATFARFAEEAQGGHADATASEELDRYFRMAKSFAEIMDDSDTFRMEIHAKGSSADGGAISRLFGSSAGQQAQALPEPIHADDVFHEVMDAELVTNSQPEDEGRTGA